jgi:hypothetical protein
LNSRFYRWNRKKNKIKVAISSCLLAFTSKMSQRISFNRYLIIIFFFFSPSFYCPYTTFIMFFFLYHHLKYIQKEISESLIYTKCYFGNNKGNSFHNISLRAINVCSSSHHVIFITHFSLIFNLNCFNCFQLYLCLCSVLCVAHHFFLLHFFVNFTRRWMNNNDEWLYEWNLKVYYLMKFYYKLERFKKKNLIKW